jgi:hypothetical protein
VLTEELYTAIGKILRIAAEIEHEISLALFHYSKIAPELGFVLIGQMPIKSKVERLFYIIEIHKLQFPDGSKKYLVHAFTEFLKLRNSLAHGILLGIHPKINRIVFGTQRYDYRTDTTVFLSGESYSEEQIITAVAFAENLLSNVRKTFGAPPWPDRHALLTHARPPRHLDLKPSDPNPAPPQPPPPPSRK